MSEWVLDPVTGVFREFGVVSEAMQTIAQPVTLVDASDAKPLRVTKAKIEICNLTHNYGRDSGGLNRLNLTIQSGEEIGLIGQSGAGKSTLFKLLFKFYNAGLGKS